MERRTRLSKGGNGHTRSYRSMPVSQTSPPSRPPDMCGAVGWIDGDGVDRFNFPQTVWLYPRVQMRATRSLTRAAEALAINILSLVLADRDWEELEGKQSERASRLARSFYEDCLSELPNDGWCIPLDTVREWLLMSRRDARCSAADDHAEPASIA